MTDTEILREMFHPKVNVPKIEHGKCATATLSEPGRESKITITGLPLDAVIIKADAFPAPSDFFVGKKHECKRADFIVISEQRKIAIFIEMKEGKGRGDHVDLQLRCALCIFGYCREIGLNFWGCNDFLKDYKCRFASIRQISIAKNTSRNNSWAGSGKSPENMFKIKGVISLPFNKLIQ